MKTLKLLPVDLSLFGLLLLCTTFTPVAGVQPTVHTIRISQMQFNPATLTVHKGDTIVFVNKDIVTHDATEISGKAWKSPALASGDSWRMAATKSAAFYCSFHPVMKGKIVVK
ncbi:cupredoxin domain-containing protein [Pontibacter sp. Tf4]|uniref:plastocyanin/azurin family copper-binding protein n=1 Tax=Pontibacter sp. Tf4 TaxID=2761620 RepID=UPI001628D4C4|nr:plastocyanin/azurin family copper-binding protein [Pontibacter sp. Tf4]MBB6611588.1 cupredoxin domain-containing protein [Pontibacter sp. Tf4]